MTSFSMKAVLIQWLSVMGFVYSVSLSRSQYNSLESLYNSTNGWDWDWQNITTSGPLWFNGVSSPCDTPSWQGVTCSCEKSECNIVSISLSGYNLNGFIPDSISNFSSLSSLDLSSNNLNKTIPESLYLLTKLTELILNDNFLSGPVSNAIAGLTSLTNLELQDNSINSSIPSVIGDLTKLEILKLSRNSLEGTLPLSLYKCDKLIELYLDSNVLSGSLSSDVGNLKLLRYLQLHSNLLTNSIPSSLGQLTQLEGLYLNKNRFNGSIPEELYICNQLIMLVLDQNQLTGSLSEGLGNLTNLYSLDLHSNQLTGTLPRSIGRLSNLVYLYVNINEFHGTLPEEIYNLTALEHWFLASNHFSGTLSLSIGNLTHMNQIDFYSNNFTGSIPHTIGRMPELRYLYLNHNSLNGTIPDSFYLNTKCRNVYMDHNYLSGSISAALGNWTHITEYDFNNNLITGSLPPVYADLRNLYVIYADNNFITGHIPELCHSPVLNELFLQYNYMSGTIPACIFGNKYFREFVASNNLFTGSIPSALDSPLLDTFEVYYNELTGPLPTEINVNLFYFEINNNDLTGRIESLFADHNPQYNQISIQNNHLSGTLSSVMGQWTDLQILEVSSNLLSGSIPSELSALSYLTILFLNTNAFTGTVNCFNGTSQLSLRNVELSNNQLSGPIPAAAFGLPSLSSFAAVSNCFTGSLPEAICGASTLTALALDGLHTASSCRQSLLHRVSNSYGLKYYLPGSLPSCLFNMSILNTLHVSGNGLAGSLPSGLVLGSALTDLALSYNQFTGGIPEQISVKPFDSLDLSFNRLDGILSSSTEVPVNSSLSLQVNRISGQIPLVMREVESISILDGNHFECQLNRRSLPVHDKQHLYYDCGTSALQHSMYGWIVLFGLVVVGLFVVWWLLRGGASDKCSIALTTDIKTVASWYEILVEGGKDYGNVEALLQFMSGLRRLLLWISVFAVALLMPTNATLNQYFGMYELKYAWVVASVFLSGFTPALALLILFSLLFVWLFAGVLMSFQSNGLESENVESMPTSLSQSYYMQYLYFMGIALFNFVVVLAINISYVLIATHYDTSIVTVTQFVLASFKLAWNDFAIRNITQSLNRYASLTPEERRIWESRSLVFNTYLMIFNVIVIPCLATAAVSSDCFYDVLVPPSDVKSYYSYTTCASLQTISEQFIGNCTSYETTTKTTSYLPPFMYRYQCASTLVTTYAVLYVYKFILVSFVQPVFIIVLVRIVEGYPAGSMLHRAALSFLPQVFKIESDFGSKDVRLFYKDRFNLRIIMYLSVLLTFGIIFPPLVVMITVAVWVQSYFILLGIGRVVHRQTAQRAKLLQCLHEDTAHVTQLFRQTLNMIAPFAAVFYAYAVFDMYGDQVGATAAVWMPVVMFAVGSLITTIAGVHGRWRQAGGKERIFSGEKIELKAVSSKMSADILEETENALAVKSEKDYT